jgi:DNA-binding HxlR family transcriptional regulator
VREAFYDASRFTEFRRKTYVSRKILTDGLNALFENQLFMKIDIGLRGKRAAFVVTGKGKAKA